MRSRRKRLEKARLYVILDREACGRRDAVSLARWLARAGADILQYRDKRATFEVFVRRAARIRASLSGSGVLFIVNDHAGAVLEADADGVHLGQEDMRPQTARRMLGRGRIIGVSTHSLRQARRAQAQGADYIGFGPLEQTQTKPEYTPVGIASLGSIAGRLNIPVFAIGNVTRVNLGRIMACGAERVAVCRGILKSRDPGAAAAYYKRRLTGQQGTVLGR